MLEPNAIKCGREQAQALLALFPLIFAPAPPEVCTFSQSNIFPCWTFASLPGAAPFAAML